MYFLEIWLLAHATSAFHFLVRQTLPGADRFWGIYAYSVCIYRFQGLAVHVHVRVYAYVCMCAYVCGVCTACVHAWSPHDLHVPFVHPARCSIVRIWSVSWRDRGTRSWGQCVDSSIRSSSLSSLGDASSRPRPGLFWSRSLSGWVHLCVGFNLLGIVCSCVHFVFWCFFCCFYM